MTFTTITGPQARYLAKFSSLLSIPTCWKFLKPGNVSISSTHTDTSSPIIILNVPEYLSDKCEDAPIKTKSLFTMDAQQQHACVECSKNELRTKKMSYNVLASVRAASRNFFKFNSVNMITREKRTNMRQRDNNFKRICCCCSCNFFTTIYSDWFLQSRDVLCCTRVAVACSL